MPAGIDRASLKAIERSIDENQHRPLPKLFAEALLLRIMESLGEQILNCPERLALLYYHSVRTAVEAVANEAAPISYLDLLKVFFYFDCCWFCCYFLLFVHF
ncbi:unnamed protein product [Polarella glacialis]|uniref:Uncharacterized protein n=1 Tax=Polarella glacialis TaxID=89957 RepID=A0A813HYN8_POLGL|nr:unnamed protein product [Polarella glacialis]